MKVLQCRERERERGTNYREEMCRGRGREERVTTAREGGKGEREIGMRETNEVREIDR